MRSEIYDLVPHSTWTVHEQYMLYIKFNTAVILITSYLPLVLLSSVKISDEIHHAILILSLFLSTAVHVVNVDKVILFKLCNEV